MIGFARAWRKTSMGWTAAVLLALGGTASGDTTGDFTRGRALLDACGHGPSVVNGVPFGNKVTYHHHAVWYAEHGYVCLVLDSLELGEIRGVHHGTSRLNQWWWQTLGYTPAGIECWNALRAL